MRLQMRRFLWGGRGSGGFHCWKEARNTQPCERKEPEVCNRERLNLRYRKKARAHLLRLKSAKETLPL